MIGGIICLLVFAFCYTASRLSLAKGIASVLAVGYLYGITRANFTDQATYFAFDVALIGLYAAQLFKPQDGPMTPRAKSLHLWLLILTLWPTLLAFVPIQTPLVSLVGLRGNIFFLPILLLGSRLVGDDLTELSLWIAALNLIALTFAIAEFAWGVERFFPANAVTEILFKSGDASEDGALRIPSCFSSAHAYAGTMVVSMPFLLASWVRKQTAGLIKIACSIGMICAIFGVLLASTRQHFLMLAVVLLAANVTMKINASVRVAVVLCLAIVGVVVSQQERMQRFTKLKDTDDVKARVAISVNESFWDVALQYPLGNGMGGGGTNMPSFIAGQLRNRVLIENEYARILLEQGWMGFALWISFFLWAFSRTPVGTHSWIPGRKVAGITSAAYCATAFIGLGLLVSIPQSLLILLSLGWFVSGGPSDPNPSTGTELLDVNPVIEAQVGV